MTAQSFPAFGGTVIVAVGESSALEPALAATRAVIDAVDIACSRFRDDSDLMASTTLPGRVEVAGAVRGAPGRRPGRRADQWPGDPDRRRGHPSPRLRPHLRVGAVGRPPPMRSTSARCPAGRPSSSTGEPPGRFAGGVELDLGATAKALAVDRVAAAAVSEHRHRRPRQHRWRPRGRRHRPRRRLVGAGGRRPRPPPRRRARPSPYSPGRWRPRARPTGAGAKAGRAPPPHRPGPGLSADEFWRTVTVAAASCVDANIATTAAMIMGREAPDWLSRRAPGPPRHARRRGADHRGLADRRAAVLHTGESGRGMILAIARAKHSGTSPAEPASSAWSC